MKIQSSRNYGIDLLRMFSMFCVIILHLLGHGGALKSTISGEDFAILWFWEIFAYPAVNCFVLVSGFVGYRNEKYFPRLKNIIIIVFSTFFYSVLFFLIYTAVSSQKIEIIGLVEAAFPILTKQYWFVSAYFALFYISPIINLCVNKADKKMLFIISLIILFFAIPSTKINAFDLNSGYSVLWFIFLYLLGAIIKKENIIDRFSFSKAFILICIGFLATWVTKIMIGIFLEPLSIFENILISYCSPTILLMAIGWLIAFSKIQTATFLNKIILFFTPSVFSVYLIHDNYYIRETFIKSKFVFINQYNFLMTSGIVLLSALIIFIVCLFIDKIKTFLFELFCIPKFVNAFEKLIKNSIHRFYNYFIS